MVVGTDRSMVRKSMSDSIFHRGIIAEVACLMDRGRSCIDLQVFFSLRPPKISSNSFVCKISSKPPATPPPPFSFY